MELSVDAATIIRRKKTQYGRFVDTQQWHLLDQIMLPEATVEFVDPSGAVINEAGVEWSLTSREDWKAFCLKTLGGQQTIHVFGDGEMEPHGAGEMKVTWSLVYHVGTPGTDGMHCTGGGFCYETWKQTGDDWYMASLKLQRVFWKIAGV